MVAERDIIVDRRSVAAVIVAFLGLLQFTVCVTEASSRYAGGFSFTDRFLSDMGRTTAPAAVLFNSSVMLLGVCLILFFAAAFRDHSEWMFRWSGILSASGLIGIGLTPLDKLFVEHHLFLVLWLLPMFPMVVLGMIGFGRAGRSAFVMGMVLLWLTVRYIASAGSRDAPWNQKLVILAGLTWLVLVCLAVLRRAVQQVCSRLKIGEDAATYRYLQRMESNNLFPAYRKRSGNQPVKRSRD